MATWFAQNSSVNIDSVNQWNSAANGSGSWLTWSSLAAGDELVANAKTSIAINVNVTCASIRNTNTLGGTASGGFTLSGSQVVTAALYSTTNTTLITVSGSGTPSFVGNRNGGGTGNTTFCILNTGSGTLTVTGDDVSAGGQGGTISNQGTGTINVTGNVTSTCSATNIGLVFLSNASGVINITGNVTGGVGQNTAAVQVTAGTLSVTGDVTGGTGANGFASGIYFTSTGTCTVTGTITGGTTCPGVTVVPASTSAAAGKLIHFGNQVSGSNGHPGVLAFNYLIHASSTLTHTFRSNSSGSAGSARSLYTGGVNLNQPTIANVRSGTVYGASNEYTGTLAVPLASLVALGVSTDNTTGTYNPQPVLLIDTTIATRSSETVFTLTSGSSDDSAYVGQTVIVTKSGSTTRKEIGTVSAYVGSTKQVTLSADPGVMTIAIGDAVCIFAGGSSGGSSFPSSAPTNWLGASGIASGALTIAKFASDLGTTAYASNPLAQAIWERLLSAMTTAGSAGKKLSDEVLQTGDSFARIGTAGAGLTALGDSRLANLDVAISVVQSQITALNNLSAKANWFGNLLLEVPDSSTRAYQFELVIKDDEDKLVNLDALPTIALANAAGTDRSALITTGIANAATGRYTLTITVGTSTVNESLKLTATGTIGAETRYAVICPQVVDYDNATQVALILTRIGTPAASVSADIAAVKTSADLALRPTTPGRTLLVSTTGEVTAELDSASLVRFVTEDTGETAAADGSVAKLSQGSGGGGGDATLANQVEILAAIQGSEVIQVASPNVSGNLVLIQGDDYDGIANPKASWTVTTDYTDGWTVALTIRNADDEIVYTTSGEVISATVIAVTIAAPTGLTMTGCPGQWQGKFDVQLTKVGSVKTIALGACYINEDQTR